MTKKKTFIRKSLNYLQFFLFLQSVKLPDRDTWGNAKVYDPTRGIRANVNCSFETPARLKVRGTVMGIGMSVYWDKIE